MTREKNEGVRGECKARAAKKNCITIYIDLVHIYRVEGRVLFLHTRVELNFFIYSVAILAILSPCTKLRLVVVACSSFYFCCEQFFAATAANCN